MALKTFLKSVYNLYKDDQMPYEGAYWYIKRNNVGKYRNILTVQLISAG